MRWFVDSTIDRSEKERKAREEFIADVSGYEPNCLGQWGNKHKGKLQKFWTYQTADIFSDICFVTAHYEAAKTLIHKHAIFRKNRALRLVLNTCMINIKKFVDLSEAIFQSNPEHRLFLTKQEKQFINGHIYFYWAALEYKGNFGFETTFSERQLYSYRCKGMEFAINEAYEEFPIPLPEDILNGLLRLGVYRG